MSSRKWFVAAGLGISILLAAAGLFAHGGGLDSNGGHTNKKTGEYHYHQKKESGSSSSETGSSSSLGSSKSSKSGSLGSYTDYQKIDALIVILERKGMTTRDELLDQLKADLKKSR